ncbi:hypothetical protein O6H91_21G034600 [Diphasiastrum complanatum]|uniref:Uncharacterized protein n=1 Tax=Diphasiastrum complanatum TaxID=34168 RepID=A0ACC2AL53_DIPCM|nr:hypothetical protein O6H91_21G034600 [Diphasiastrum complanatum]
MMHFKALALALFVAFACLAGSSITEAYSNNCHGSGKCPSVHPNDCRTAFGRYDDGTTYTGYTSLVSGSCTAIFRCDGNYPSMAGSQLKDQFNQIYASGCGRCGSHAFNGGACEATLNYCSSCTDSG